jgi:hypothetical protein
MNNMTQVAWRESLKIGDPVCIVIYAKDNIVSKITTRVKNITAANIVTEAHMRFSKSGGYHTGPGTWNPSYRLGQYDQTKMVELHDFDPKTCVALVLPKDQEILTVIHDVLCSRYGNETAIVNNIRTLIQKEFGNNAL